MSDFEWCTDCKEYNKEKHCCPRWTKVIRNTLNESINAVLDEIRAEVTAIAINGQVDEHTMFIRTGEQVKQMALNIIDKHKAESEPQESEVKMSDLEKAKEIVKAYYGVADCGIFNSRNTAGDSMTTIYNGEGLTIEVCYGYSYFEVFGLSDAEFEELERYYDSLGRK